MGDSVNIYGAISCQFDYIEMSAVPPKGIYTPLPTFFKEDFSLDLQTQLKHLNYIETSGVSGVLVGGSNGEAVHLTREERFQLVKTVRENVNKDFVVMVGVIGNAIKEILVDIAELKKLGADYAVLLVPGYFGTSLVKQAGIIDWFTMIADNAELPIIIYNYPGVQNGIELTYDSYIKLSQHPNIVGCKLTHYNFPLYILLGQSQQLKTNNFRVLAGVGQVLLPGLAIGAEGCIDGLSNIFPKSMVKIFNLYEEGNLEEAQKLQGLVTTVNEMTAVLNILGIKYALKYAFGFGEIATGRPPLNQEIDLNVWNKYQKEFEKLLEYEKKL